MIKKITLTTFASCILMIAFAQTDSIPPEEPIDFSQFANASVDNSVKRYCTSKVLGLSPNKLISIGYDWQGKQEVLNEISLGGITLKDNMEIKSASGLRFTANVPVISNTKWLVSLGANYWRVNYNTGDAKPLSYFNNQLNTNGLTTLGLNATLFKPLNEKNFILSFISADANGAFKLDNSQLGEYLTSPKYTVAAFYGWKRNDRSMIAFGASRTYRPGAQGYIPLILFNHTFESKKWGIESLFPARLAVRRTINTRNLLFFGYELEGNSYSIINTTNPRNNFYDNLELRRSEIRPRITYERSLYQFIWLSVQVGYRINYNFNVDQGDDLRLLGSDAAYYMTNTLSNAPYFQVGINLVSP